MNYKSVILKYDLFFCLFEVGYLCVLLAILKLCRDQVRLELVHIVLLLSPEI